MALDILRYSLAIISLYGYQNAHRFSGFIFCRLTCWGRIAMISGLFVRGNTLRLHSLTSCSALSMVILAEPAGAVIVCRLFERPHRGPLQQVERELPPSPESSPVKGEEYKREEIATPGLP
jgi:hypothetical protein